MLVNDGWSLSELKALPFDELIYWTKKQSDLNQMKHEEMERAGNK